MVSPSLHLLLIRSATFLSQSMLRIRKSLQHAHEPCRMALFVTAGLADDQRVTKPERQRVSDENGDNEITNMKPIFVCSLL